LRPVSSSWQASARRLEKVGGRDERRVRATTNVLAAGREEIRDAVRKVVEEALGKGWIDEKKAEGWLEKLEKGLTLREGWPRYNVQLTEGALVVRYRSTDPDRIEQVARRLREIGLEEGRHFTVKMPEGREAGYVYVRREGLERAAWLSVHGSGEQQRLAAEFVSYILQRAREEGDAVYEKAREVVEEGKARDSLKLEGFEKKVEVDGKEYVVKVVGWGAEFDEGRSGKKLLRIKITAEVDGVRNDYTIIYSRRGARNETVGRAYVSADTPEGREAGAERFTAVIKALTGREPRIIERSNGKIEVECGRGHLDGFARYAELADAIEKWLEETNR